MPRDWKVRRVGPPAHQPGSLLHQLCELQLLPIATLSSSLLPHMCALSTTSLCRNNVNLKVQLCAHLFQEAPQTPLAYVALSLVWVSVADSGCVRSLLPVVNYLFCACI